MRILIVEDNLKLANGLKLLLTDSGYGIDIVGDGESALAAALALNYDLIILDLSLPDISGLKVLEGIRAKKNAVPVLILTARGSLDDRIKGLDIGADDYMSKPFEWSELEARVRALLRRSLAVKTSRLEFGNISLDLKGNQVLANKEAIDIPAREINVLRELMMANGRIISKSRIIESLSSFDDDISENAIEQYISRLRKRISSYGLTIKTARGLGYFLQITKS
ncbi:MAG: DNA-binding response regulator [Hyphomicrobiales bacterium]|nr:response regulator [Hyphomicrobiales bacterium]PCH49856.1 MAG: DNA-binding response regulator [Hyphomicrobiales bacterium]